MIQLACPRERLGVWPNPHAVLAQSRNVLNLYEDSRREVTVTFRVVAKNKVHKSVMFGEGRNDFSNNPSSLCR
jgi:hypothetical protein